MPLTSGTTRLAFTLRIPFLLAQPSNHQTPNARNAKATRVGGLSGIAGGADGTRTRDLRRDRPNPGGSAKSPRIAYPPVLLGPGTIPWYPAPTPKTPLWCKVMDTRWTPRRPRPSAATPRPTGGTRRRGHRLRTLRYYLPLVHKYQAFLRWAQALHRGARKIPTDFIADWLAEHLHPLPEYVRRYGFGRLARAIQHTPPRLLVLDLLSRQYKLRPDTLSRDITDGRRILRDLVRPVPAEEWRPSPRVRQLVLQAYGDREQRLVKDLLAALEYIDLHSLTPHSLRR